MKRFFSALFLCLSVSAFAKTLAPDNWHQANKRVHEAGGWKAYAREIHGASSESEQPNVSGQALSLHLAIERALSLEPSLRQALQSIPRDPAKYLLLTDHQKALLTQEAQLISEVSIFWYNAVAAKEHAIQQERVSEVASIASELSSRMHRVGNLNTLHQAEDLLTYSQSKNDLAKSQLEFYKALEKLALRLQVVGNPRLLDLPSRLPEAPNDMKALQLDETDATLLSTETGNPAFQKLLSEVRLAVRNREEAFRLVNHYKSELLPLQRQISEEHLLHYNGMIIGVFELLKDAKQQAKLVNDYLAALHSYWVAEAAVNPKLAALREQLSTFRRNAWK